MKHTIFTSLLIYLSYFYILCKCQLDIKSVFIAVKTSQLFETSRLQIILDTWFNFAKEQIWFFTDFGDSPHFKNLQNVSNGHLIKTNCGTSNGNLDLCCKTSSILTLFQLEEIQPKWLCLFDDDNYVNVPKLVKELQKYNYNHFWYLGRKYFDETTPALKAVSENKKLYTFYYGTIGAGVCLSRALFTKIQSYLRSTDGYTSFINLCSKIKSSDDVTLGYLIEKKLNVNLTHVPTFHSHLENLGLIPTSQLKYQISLSYENENTITVEGFLKKDPSRFYSLHCHLGYCKKRINRYHLSSSLWNDEIINNDSPLTLSQNNESVNRFERW